MLQLFLSLEFTNKPLPVILASRSAFFFLKNSLMSNLVSELAVLLDLSFLLLFFFLHGLSKLVGGFNTTSLVGLGCSCIDDGWLVSLVGWLFFLVSGWGGGGCRLVVGFGFKFSGGLGCCMWVWLVGWLVGSVGLVFNIGCLSLIFSLGCGGVLWVGFLAGFLTGLLGGGGLAGNF